jgi:hypothetical protein
MRKFPNGGRRLFCWVAISERAGEVFRVLLYPSRRSGTHRVGCW